MSLKPIIADIETSGYSKEECGIWQIGAVDLNKPRGYFIDEARIDDTDIVLSLPGTNVLEILGKTEDELRDPNKQSQKQLLGGFFDWIKLRGVRMVSGQNSRWDVDWIEVKSEKYGLKKPFQYRSLDLHSMAQLRHYDSHGEFLTKDNYSHMNLKNVLKFCGFPDDPRGNHNALEDAKLAAECFTRLTDGKNLFPEYTQFEVPEVLRK